MTIVSVEILKIEDGLNKTWIVSNSLYFYNLNNDADTHLLMFFKKSSFRKKKQL